MMPSASSAGHSLTHLHVYPRLWQPAGVFLRVAVSLLLYPLLGWLTLPVLPHFFFTFILFLDLT